MMKIYKYLSAALAVCGSIFALGSCDPDNPEEKPIFDGGITFNMNGYARVGDVLELDAYTTKARTDGTKDIGYYWSSTYDNKLDTVQREHTVQADHIKWTYTVPDSVGIFTIKIVAYADTYETSSVSQEFTVVKEGLNGNSSITNFDTYSDDTTLTDPRDGKEYLCTKIGETTWMRQNLAWEEKGKPNIGQKALTNIFGHFYSWEEAREACPEGWSLPSEDDWVELAKVCGAKDPKKFDTFYDIAGNAMVNAKFNGSVLWEFWPAVKITDSSRFAAMPVGYATHDDDSFVYWDFSKYACFWTSEEYDGGGVYRYLVVDVNHIYANTADKTQFCANVRCVKH